MLCAEHAGGVCVGDCARGGGGGECVVCEGEKVGWEIERRGLCARWGDDRDEMGCMVYMCGGCEE